MNHGQWRLVYPGTDYTFGSSADPVFNRKAPEFGTPEVRTDDADRPRADGRAFGVDHFGGQTISFDLGVRALSDAEVREQTALLRRVWRADPVRLTPGAVAELHSLYAGRERVVYGRPRRFSPDFSDAAVNRHVSVLADFAAVDDVFYGVADSAAEISLVPPQVGGLVAPLASPLSTTRTSDRSATITVETELDAWPVLEITGPIINPVFEVVGVFRWEVRDTVAEDEPLVIDSRPWVRSALRNGASVGGKLRGTRLSQSAIPAGTYEVALRGTDPTGTASARLSWRPRFSGM